MRWIKHLLIASYLLALAAGIVAHGLKVGTNSHPLMYFIVWDMYCGWAAHECRIHLVAEGESGTHYEVLPPPWGDFAPFGTVGRQHYDTVHNSIHRMGLNVLKQTDHEPIVRLKVIEESWPKKYNLPEHLWAARFEEPREPMSYFWNSEIFDGEGEVINSVPVYLTQLYNQAIGSNPRLAADARKNQSFIAINPAHRRAAFAGHADAISQPHAGPPGRSN
jgi:hypothetical protein